MANIGVFLGANPQGVYGNYHEDAHQLGFLLAQKKHQLIYGGSSAGLMGVIADSCLAAGGKVIGFLPSFLKDYEIAHQTITELHFVDGLAERKERMIVLSDAFIIMPGGLGTLDEFLEVWSMAQLGRHKKPISILNTNGFFDHFFEFLRHMQTKKFLRGTAENYITVNKDPLALLENIFNKLEMGL